MRFGTLTAGLLSLPLFACSTTGSTIEGDEGWKPGGKADETGVTLQFQSYDVMFTNPLCREYTYANPVESADGSTTLTAKPKNVYCSYDDTDASGARPESPQHKLLSWLEPLVAGDEVFLAYLSFSSRAVSDALCAAAERGVAVTFVLDSRSTQADRLEQCGATILLRGHAGSIGYAHNKVTIINPHGDSQYMKLAFSSGNMSSGVVTHHENWHFIDVERDSYFAQAHVCLKEAQVSETASAGRTEYRNHLNACRDDIDALEEDDIKAFFIPALEDRRRAERYLLGAIDEAEHVDIGVHRFGHSGLVAKLADKLETGELSVRMVADDDLYWLDPEVGTGSQVGSNDFFESENVKKLETAGGDEFEIRYFETNHGAHMLHHNKYVMYRDGQGAPFGLIAGAANLTKSGFNDNFENIYFIKVPGVLDAFEIQFARVWDGQRHDAGEQDPPIATPRGLMPAQDVTPQ